jgi:5-formyltetrahydrofolate cyclo-ligase
MRTEQKKRFRKDALSVLRKVAQRSTYVIDKTVVEKLYREIKAQNVTSCMLYVPLGMEVDICPLIHRLRREGVKVYVPYVTEESFILVPFRLPLVKNRFGILEPRSSQYHRRRVIDIAVVPIVGVDYTLRRIGFGKGMYDRFFEKHHNDITSTLFTARYLCYTPHLISNTHDISADKVIAFDTRHFS